VLDQAGRRGGDTIARAGGKPSKMTVNFNDYERLKRKVVKGYG